MCLYHVDAVDDVDGAVVVFVVLIAVFLCVLARKCLLCTEKNFVRCFC